LPSVVKVEVVGIFIVPAPALGELLGIGKGYGVLAVLLNPPKMGCGSA